MSLTYLLFSARLPDSSVMEERYLESRRESWLLKLKPEACTGRLRLWPPGIPSVRLGARARGSRSFPTWLRP